MAKNTHFDGYHVAKSLDSWMKLERHLTGLPDLDSMKEDVRLPISQFPIHARKTDAHLSKSVQKTKSGLYLLDTGRLLDSKKMFARATAIWLKLVAGYHIKPFYITSNNQEEFITGIHERASSIPQYEKWSIADSVIEEVQGGGFNLDVEELERIGSLALAGVYQAANNEVSMSETQQACQRAQRDCYEMAARCLVIQMIDSESPASNMGIYEPGPEAESERIIPFVQLAYN